MTYDAVSYWAERGVTYESSFVPATYAIQETMLVRALDGLGFDTVLEVGCGFGRVGQLIRAIRPTAAYRGIDMSPAMVAAARRNGVDAQVASLATYRPRARSELVIAVEVLMHIPPEELPAAVDRLFALSSRHVLTVDWTRARRRPTSPHNFLHDYSSLHRPGWRTNRVRLANQSIFVMSRP